MLCQGLGLLGQRSACVLTDTSREPLSPDGRRYVTADARTPEALHKVVSKLRTMNGWIGVIDGGGNRAEMDRTLNGLADIVLLPFRDSHEDLRTVLRDLEAFPHAYALPSQWPTNAWQQEAADRRRSATSWVSTPTASCSRSTHCRPASCCCRGISRPSCRRRSATPAARSRHGP
jgi:chromosome partitioning protein